jgi:hypothetical protein
LANRSVQSGAVVVQRDFAPALADARTPAPNPKVSEPSMVTLYDRVFRLVRDEYVEPVPTDKMTHGSLEAMLAALDDPRSQFLRPEQREQFARALNGEIQGIGAVLTVVKRKTTLRVGDETAPLEQNLLQVVAVAPNSPAEKGGAEIGRLHRRHRRAVDHLRRPVRRDCPAAAHAQPARADSPSERTRPQATGKQHLAQRSHSPPEPDPNRCQRR